MNKKELIELKERELKELKVRLEELKVKELELELELDELKDLEDVIKEVKEEVKKGGLSVEDYRRISDELIIKYRKENERNGVEDKKYIIEQHEDLEDLIRALEWYDEMGDLGSYFEYCNKVKYQLIGFVALIELLH